MPNVPSWTMRVVVSNRSHRGADSAYIGSAGPSPNKCRSSPSGTNSHVCGTYIARPRSPCAMSTCEQAPATVIPTEHYLDITQENLGLPVSLLDGAMTGVRSSMELERISISEHRTYYVGRTSRYNSPLLR